METRISTSKIVWLAALISSIALVASITAGQARAASTTKIYVCIAGDFKTLNLTTKKKRCPRGQKKVSWNVVGEPGKPGAKGSPGSNGSSGANGAPGAQGPQGPQGATGAGGGATGATGAPGPQGATGEVGVQGALGPTGAAGPTGPTGPPGQDGQDGEDGQDGATGPTGAPGATGATGPAGQDGSSGAYLGTSGEPASMLMDVGSPSTTWFPLSGAANAPDGSWNDVMQYSPGDVTVSRVRATFSATVAMNNVFPLDLNVNVYSASSPMSVAPPFSTFAGCTITLPAIVNIGDVYSCDAITNSPMLASEGVAVGATLSSVFPMFIVATGNLATAVNVD